MSSQESKKRPGMFGKIETKEDALKVIKDTAIAFYVVAALQIVLAFFIGLSAIIDGIIYIVLAFLLQKFNSRIVAVLMLILTGIGVVVTAMNRLGSGQGGRNILLALVMIWASIRAIQATFRLNTLSSEEETGNQIVL
jgi:uncharacterized membrane protein HdeD (DUF308 family)